MKSSYFNYTLRRAFTLVEILVVLAIVVILIVLLFPQVNSLREKSLMAKCTGNLRQTGVVFRNYASEHSNSVRFLRDGAGYLMWFIALRDQAGFSDEEALKIFSCPATPKPPNNFRWFCYGMRLGYLTIPIVKDPGFPIVREKLGSTYGFNLSTVENPSKFFLMADSATTTGRQTFRIVQLTSYAGSGASLRHRGRTNVLFLDGHIESMGAAELYEFGFRQALDKENQVITLTPDT